jgi:hypothetical protein
MREAYSKFLIFDNLHFVNPWREGGGEKGVELFQSFGNATLELGV